MTIGRSDPSPHWFQEVQSPGSLGKCGQTAVCLQRKASEQKTKVDSTFGQTADCSGYVPRARSAVKLARRGREGENATRAAFL